MIFLYNKYSIKEYQKNEDDRLIGFSSVDPIGYILMKVAAVNQVNR
jgi:NADH:ubiquinone oxidoreductase subunit 2 (subunit N)